MQRTTPSLATAGPIGPRSLITAATVQPRSRATNAVTVDAAGIQKLNMLHTLNTEPRAPGPWFKSQAPSFKLDRSSGLGYHRTNGKVQQRSRFVGPSHITNRRHAHLVRSSMRAARKYPGLPVDSNVLMVMERPGDRETPVTGFSQQATSLKLQAASFKRLNY